MGVIESVQVFVDEIRDLHRAGLEPQELWEQAQVRLQEVLADPALHRASRTWPLSHDRTNQKYTNLLFYEDDEFGFVVNGLVKDESGNTAVHDHGHSWVLYGLLEGEEVVTRYERVDDRSVDGHAELAQTGELTLKQGEVDMVEPWSAHKERALTDRTVAVIVRSANVGDFLRGRYDLDGQTVELSPGPEQIPYPF